MKPRSASRQEFLIELQSGKLDGVVAICDRAPYSLAVTGKFDKELVQALPKSIKYICHNGKEDDSTTTAQ